MEIGFYIAGTIAIIATLAAITRKNAMHALLYLILSLLSVAVVFYTIGAPFIAALEVIIYAGAIMVLFIFVIMLLNLGPRAAEMERHWWSGTMWIGPSILAAVLLGEVCYLLFTARASPVAGAIEPRQVGIILFGPYLLGVELSSVLLLSGLIGTYHLGWREEEKKELERGTYTDEGRVDTGRDLVHAGSRRSDRST